MQEILTNYSRGKMNPPMVVVCSEDSGWKDSVLKLVFNLEFTTKAGIEYLLKKFYRIQLPLSQNLFFCQMLGIF